MSEGAPEPEKKRLPRLDIKTRINHSPHVLILGAGASRACCPSGDKNGRHLPLMADFAEKVGIGQIIKDAGHEPSENFEHIYSQIYSAKNEDALRKLDLAIRNYFEQLALPDVPTLYDYLVLSLMTCH